MSFLAGSYEEEERKRNVIGLSARGKCLVLLEIVESMGSDSANSYAAVSGRLTSEWSQDTIKRYVSVARKIQSQPKLMDALTQLEYEQGRDSALDGITALRGLVGLNLDENDAVFVVTWMRFRSCMAGLTCLRCCFAS